MISVMAELINSVIRWLKTGRRLSPETITGVYILGGTVLMIIIPAKIFITVEGTYELLVQHVVQHVIW